MFTINYKGFYIHGKFATDEVRVTFASGSPLGTTGIFKSYRAGQLAITKFLSYCY